MPKQATAASLTGPLIATVRALPRKKAEERFDRIMREQGVIRSALSGGEAKAYDTAKEGNVHVCVALHDSPRKQEVLKHRAQAADRWAEQEAAQGRWHWGTEVPERVYEAAGVAAPQAIRPASGPRQRGSGAPRRRRGTATSRAGDSGDREPPPSDVARPDRASRRGDLR